MELSHGLAGRKMHDRLLLHALVNLAHAENGDV